MADKSKQTNDNGENAAGSDSNLFYPGGGYFEIHIKGQLDQRWSEYLEGLEVKILENGEMILFGPVIDQAALLGILNKLSHLNLTLLSVNTINKKINKETK